jgi:hypothetical protein
LKLKVFTVRFSGSTEAFDDGPLQEFIADKEVIEYSEHFFIHENKPCLAILLAYRELESLESRRVARRADVRIQPRDTRRQLEQRRSELPVGHAQQQQARQPQQQRGLPPLQLTATVRSGVFKDAPPVPTP